MRKLAALIIIVLGIAFLAFVGSVVAQNVHRFGSGPLMASGTFVTTVTKNQFQNPQSVFFVAQSKSMTSSNESLLQQTVNGGSASSAMVGASSGSAQLVYCFSSALDGTLGIYPNTAGTGSVISGGSVSVTAGQPFEWDYLTSGSSNQLQLTSSNSIVFTAGTLAGGVTTSSTQTAVTAVGLFP